jgi:hypothetical protein
VCVCAVDMKCPLSFDVSIMFVLRRKTQMTELIPMISYFSDIVKDLKERTDVATKALFGGDVGTAQVSSIFHLVDTIEVLSVLSV